MKAIRRCELGGRWGKGSLAADTVVDAHPVGPSGEDHLESVLTSSLHPLAELLQRRAVVSEELLVRLQRRDAFPLVTARYARVQIPPRLPCPRGIEVALRPDLSGTLELALLLTEACADGFLPRLDSFLESVCELLVGVVTKHRRPRQLEGDALGDGAVLSEEEVRALDLLALADLQGCGEHSWPVRSTGHEPRRDGVGQDVDHFLERIVAVHQPDRGRRAIYEEALPASVAGIERSTE